MAVTEDVWDQLSRLEQFKIGYHTQWAIVKHSYSNDFSALARIEPVIWRILAYQSDLIS